MKQTFLCCDKAECKSQQGRHFNLFSDRHLDGAGSMEDIFLGFDLCPAHQEDLLKAILYKINKNTATINHEDIIKILTNLKIYGKEE